MFLLPPLAAWEAVVSGWIDHETTFHDLHAYELVMKGESAELQYRTSGKYREVIWRAASPVAETSTSSSFFTQFAPYFANGGLKAIRAAIGSITGDRWLRRDWNPQHLSV